MIEYRVDTHEDGSQSLIKDLPEARMVVVIDNPAGGNYKITDSQKLEPADDHEFVQLSAQARTHHIHVDPHTKQARAVSSPDIAAP